MLHRVLTVKGIFCEIAEKFCTFVIAINFAIPPISYFTVRLGEFFLSITKIQNFYHIINQFVTIFSLFLRHSLSNYHSALRKLDVANTCFRIIRTRNLTSLYGAFFLLL